MSSSRTERWLRRSTSCTASSTLSCRNLATRSPGRSGHPLPGAKELITALGEGGYEIWFVTSAKDEELEHHMSELEAEGRISGVVNSSDVENSKPAPDTDIFELTLERADA